MKRVLCLLLFLHSCPAAPAAPDLLPNSMLNPDACGDLYNYELPRFAFLRWGPTPMTEQEWLDTPYKQGVEQWRRDFLDALVHDLWEWDERKGGPDSWMLWEFGQCMSKASST